MKKIISLVLIVFTVLSLIGASCIYYYEGPNYDLFTVAMNSLVFTTGYVPNSGRSKGPMVKILEKDMYGRVMFIYHEKDLVEAYTLLISQKIDNDNVYYYEDINYITKLSSNFTFEEIANLKELNDWGQPLNEKKLFKTKIITKRIIMDDYETNLTNSIFSSCLKMYDVNNIWTSYTVRVSEDAYGRVLYSCIITVQNNSTLEVDDKKCILLISDSLGSNNTVFVKSIYDCNQIIKEFKHANNWNKPINN